MQWWPSLILIILMLNREAVGWYVVVFSFMIATTAWTSFSSASVAAAAVSAIAPVVEPPWGLGLPAQGPREGDTRATAAATAAAAAGEPGIAHRGAWGAEDWVRK